MICSSSGVRWIFAMRQYRLKPKNERVSDREMCEYMDHQRERLRREALTIARTLAVNRRVVSAMRPLVSRMLSSRARNGVVESFLESGIGAPVWWGVFGVNCWAGAESTL